MDWCRSRAPRVLMRASDNGDGGPVHAQCTGFYLHINLALIVPSHPFLSTSEPHCLPLLTVTRFDSN